jgi:hypothetical protein
MSNQISHGSRQDGQNVQELQRDLARKHHNVGSKVDAIWRNFTPKQREKAMRESIGDGMALKHSRDRSLGVLCEYIPEYNLRGMTSKPEHFLNIFEFRASKPLFNQLYEGANGLPGDRELMERTGLRCAEASNEERTIFPEGDNYGHSIQPTAHGGGRLPPLSFERANIVIIPRAIGELIVLRQQYLLQFLNHIVEEILDLGSQTRTKKAPEKNPQEALTTAFTNLNVQPKPLKSSLPEVLMQAM